jgi:hypothetical protein
VLPRLTYLGIANAFALLRLLPGSDRARDAEILALRRGGRFPLVTIGARHGGTGGALNCR